MLEINNVNIYRFAMAFLIICQHKNDKMAFLVAMMEMIFEMSMAKKCESVPPSHCYHHEYRISLAKNPLFHFQLI